MEPEAASDRAGAENGIIVGRDHDRLRKEGPKELVPEWQVQATTKWKPNLHSCAKSAYQTIVRIHQSTGRVLGRIVATGGNGCIAGIKCWPVRIVEQPWRAQI